MAQLNDFSKIIVGGNEISKVLHQGKTIWQKDSDVYLAQDSDFIFLGGGLRWIGSEKEIEIPPIIHGDVVTSYNFMFNMKDTWLGVEGGVTKIVNKNHNVTSFYNMFLGYDTPYLDLSEFNLSDGVDVGYMFSLCKAKTLDLSGFNTSNVTNMSGMFYDSSATTLDLSSFDTSNVTNMGYMFSNSSATTLDLSSFDTSNVTNMSSMFEGSKATTGYARTQADANKFNASSKKPAGLNFVVKP